MWLLDDYGIKHGPVVGKCMCTDTAICMQQTENVVYPSWSLCEITGTTRHLYEKKLRDAITKAKKTRVKKGRPPIDMSMYRDEGGKLTRIHSCLDMWPYLEGLSKRLVVRKPLWFSFEGGMKHFHESLVQPTLIAGMSRMFRIHCLCMIPFQRKRSRMNHAGLR